MQRQYTFITFYYISTSLDLIISLVALYWLMNNRTHRILFGMPMFQGVEVYHMFI